MDTISVTKRTLYGLVARIISLIHILLIVGNLISVPFLVLYTPFYICIPLITMLVSPVLGGSYCLFNRLENYFRYKAGRPQITCRVNSLYKGDI